MTDLDTMVQDYAETTGKILPSDEEAKSDKKVSKSQRIRDYFEKNPEARNRDAVAALELFGVTAADVANVKAAQKRKAAKKAKSSTKASEPVASANTASSSASEMDLNVSIGLDVLDAGTDFVRKAGGINEAMYVLNVIKRIRSA